VKSRGVLAAVFVHLILDGSHNLEMTLPQPQPRFVDSHLNEPGAEPRFEPELCKILERFQERVLYRVFRVRSFRRIVNAMTKTRLS